jgi:hypothetical protein
MWRVGRGQDSNIKKNQCQASLFSVRSTSLTNLCHISSSHIETVGSQTGYIFELGSGIVAVDRTYRERVKRAAFKCNKSIWASDKAI